MMTQNKPEHISRADEIRFILNCVADGDCCAVVGLSNLGKSALLRSITPAVAAEFEHLAAEEYVFIYIDFNLMVDMTEQAFYELILRSIRSMLYDLANDSLLGERIEKAYNRVVDSSNPFLVPLGFNEGIMALCEGLHKHVILLFDEFDEPFNQIDQRVFLNLRALQDRYAQQFYYVVATCKRLEDMRQGTEIGEFGEMFAHQTLYLRPLNKSDTQKDIYKFLTHERVVPVPRDVEFVWKRTGGHPGLTEAVCHLLVTIGGKDRADEDYNLVSDKLDSDLSVRNECVKLWSGLDQKQQETLINFVGGKGVSRDQLTSLLQCGILQQTNYEIDVFCTLFDGFIRRQRLLKTPYLPGVHVDVDAGQVVVDGQTIPTLTELEYRLLLLLYGRMGKICDKYRIVEYVWGEEYIDNVEDARIEKLISRLRKKIEPDPNEPRYLQTVRGRGYRLVEV